MAEDLHVAPSMLTCDILTGLSDKVISDIESNAHYLLGANDLYAEYIYDVKTADSILNLIDTVLSQN